MLIDYLKLINSVLMSLDTIFSQIKISIFGPFMKDMNLVNMKSGLIVTYKCQLSDLFKLQFFK